MKNELLFLGTIEGNEFYYKPQGMKIWNKFSIYKLNEELDDFFFKRNVPNTAMFVF